MGERRCPLPRGPAAQVEAPHRSSAALLLRLQTCRISLATWRLWCFCGLATLLLGGVATFALCGFATMVLCGVATLVLCLFATLLLCCSATLRLCCSATLRLCYFAALLLCCFAPLLLNSSAALLLCCLTPMLLCSSAALPPAPRRLPRKGTIQDSCIARRSSPSARALPT